MSIHSNDKIDELINYLKQNNNFKNKVLLFEGLNELKNMVEMDQIKLTIIEQIKLLVVNKCKNENHMLHTVITGDPAAGKTSVARILAKIWISLDMIKQPKKKADKSYVELLEKAVIEYDYKVEQLSKGLETQRELISKIRIGVNNLKHHGNKTYDHVLKDVRNAKFNLDKILYKEQIIEYETQLKFTVASRDMLIGAYHGHTAIKTKEVLEKAAGGVLFIDEAYSLYHSDRDSFGMECLTVINEFMSLRSDELIIIFAGYKNLLETIFTAQPGLKRRCMWFFDIPSYSPNALSKIFKTQLEKQQWYCGDMDIHKIFNQYKHVLKTPGDTDKLVFQCKLAYAEYYFHLDHHEYIINKDIIIKAIDKLIQSAPLIENVPIHMYC